ncbi:MAG TPA: adenosylcobinamide-phosphate synthase CbiB [Devosiaceae bacterium]|nr:adenosylcobinamide-phosphate synthase CbiB [Devosiaceae bacterium]
MNAAIAFVAALLERLTGYPDALTAAIRHPVVWMGVLIDRLEYRLNAPSRTPSARRAGGVLMLAILIAVVAGLSAIVVLLLRPLPHGWLIEAVLAVPFLAQKQLGRAVAAVAPGLGRSLAEGRNAVAHIVGRDPDRLDEAGVARAAIESLAENTSDGVVAPLFYLLIFGLPGAAVYKAVNTADSMVGHLNERYREFGWASARLDDIANFVPARLTAVAFALVAAWLPAFDGPGSWRAARRDAGRHSSPNAGWPEAAMAGALGIVLGGPRSYQASVLELPDMGSGRRDLGAPDIRRALTLYGATLNGLLGVLAVLALAVR